MQSAQTGKDPFPRASRESGGVIRLAAMSFRERILFFLRKLPALAAGAAAVFHAAIFVVALDFGLIYSVVNPPVTALAFERSIEKGWAPRPFIFVPLSRIPPYARRMFVSLEDRTFYTHWGIEPSAMLNAFEQNARWGQIVLGGSTITQQLARTLFLSQDKTYFRKYLEALWAVVLDLVMSKERILELYLNYIEWGRGVYGIGQGSWHQFGRSVETLGPDEFARLAAIIINPVDFNVSTLSDQPAMLRRYRNLVGKKETADVETGGTSSEADVPVEEAPVEENVEPEAATAEAEEENQGATQETDVETPEPGAVNILD